MKKGKQEKGRKQSIVSSSKDLKLPLIQSNIQKGNVKEMQSSSSKGKNNQKLLNTKSNLNEIPQIPNIPNLPINKNSLKERKSFGSTHISQSTNKTRTKSGTRKKKYHYYQYKEDQNQNPNNDLIKEEVPRISEEKLSQLKEQRKKRLQEAKKEEEKEIKLYAQLIEEYKNNGKDKNKKEKIEDNPKIPKISGQKAQKILEDGGMLDAYKYVLAQLCKHGLPDGNIFEYASVVVKNYEKKWKEKKSKMIKEKIDKYYEEKQKELKMTLETEGEIRKVNKSLEHRKELKFIRSLDKSRSGRNVVTKFPSTTSQDNFGRNLNKNYRIIKETRASQEKDENIISPTKLKQFGLEKQISINKNIANSTLSSDYSKNYNNKKSNNNQFNEKDNINNVINKNGNRLKKGK